MAEQQADPSGPDLAQGVSLSEFTGETLLGHVGDQDVLLVRAGSEIFAIDAHCSHYHGPLADGLVVGDSIRCPWHHACFDLRSGEATRAPALNPLSVWQVEHEGDRIVVRQKREQPKPRGTAAVAAPDRIVIVGGGAAGFAAAEMLRRQEYRGSIVMLSNDAAPPVDRPNLSKDYLAGSAPEDWLPLRPDEFLRGSRYRPAAQDRCRLDRHQGAQRRPRRRRHGSLRPAAAGDRRRAGAAADSRRRPAACPYAALARRLPRHHRCGERRAPRHRDRREFHRAGGRGRVARARHRGSCRGARAAADGARARARDGRFRARAARGARRHLPSRRYRGRDRRQARHAQERRRAGGRCRGRRRRRAAAAGAGRTGRPCARSRRRRESTISKPASPASMPPAISRAGPIRIRRRISGSSIGWWPNARARPPRATCWARARRSTRCRFSGASITTCRSIMSAMPRSGTRSRSTAISRAGIAC